MAIKIALDAGHGYDTAGKRTYPFEQKVTHTYDGQTVTVNKGATYREHEANVGVCVYLEKELKRCGFEVYKSAWNDSNAKDDKQKGSTPSEDVIARQKDIRTKGCDYCVSIHFNAYDNKTGTWNTAQGNETLYHSVAAKVGDGKAFAVAVNNRLKDAIAGQKNRGAKSGSEWGMCNSTGLGVKAAIICELAFMTNKFEAENYMCNPEAWKKFAVAIAKGICDYTGVKYVAEPKPKIEVGYKVTINVGATYGGQALGEIVPVKHIGGSVFTVDKVQQNNGQEEARLTELVSWVPTEYLTIVKTSTTTTSAPKVQYYPKYTGKSTSIVDALNTLGIKSTYANRLKIATKNKIVLYVGSASQNTKLLNLLKQGKLIKA